MPSYKNSEFVCELFINEEEQSMSPWFVVTVELPVPEPEFPEFVPVP